MPRQQGPASHQRRLSLNDMPRALFFWAIVPPADLVEKIDSERRAFSLRFGSVKALRPPVHLTLLPPFLAAVAEVDAVLPVWQSRIAEHTSFELQLDGFGFFKTKRSPIVFIRVIPEEKLEQLHREIGRKAEQDWHIAFDDERPFQPHFTIGYRDIPYGRFEEIKQAYEQAVFKASFRAEGVSLFQHDGQYWQLHASFAMSSQA